jgi:hypothetical protein
MEPRETHLLLYRKPEQTAAAFAAAMRAALPAGATLALALPDDALPALAHAAARSPEVPDALVRLAPGTGTAGLLAASDASRALTFAAVRHSVLPGSNRIRLFFGLRRLPALDRAAFHDYWLNRHAEIGRRRIPPYSYHQLHADAAATQAAAHATDIAPIDLDGVVEVHFPDVDAFVRQLSRKEVAEEALADERNFIDHSRSFFWAFAEEEA